ncbi:lung adenoma susceptibility protein 2 [Pelobates fuscus]|uniref:lung adenoma susceptibility protein 2 n=1 Tax=Pelobates fuscus TaxID=191477 RepID=UPI002FE479C2
MARSSSPDSSLSISSLLASCSLSSSNTSSHSPSGIAYKDQLYDSASKALEAYIKDYDENLQSPGKITIGKSTRIPVTKKANPRVGSKPPSSIRRPVVRDSDLLSLTTDDLLSFPSDGSLPLSHSSFRGQKYSRTSRKQHVSSWKKQMPLSSPSNRLPKLNILDLQPSFPKGIHKESRRDRSISYGVEDIENKPVLNDQSTFLKESTLPNSYPRWLTSQKSELSVSGLTSVPDVKYPVWLKHHGLLSDSDSESTSHLYQSLETCPRLQTYRRLYGSVPLGRSHSLHVPLNDTYQDNKDSNVAPTDFVYKNITSRQSGMDINNHLNMLSKSLAQEKSEHAKDFLNERFSSPLKNDRSPRTEEILEQERSWEKIPFPLKTPVPVLCGDNDQNVLSASRQNLVEEFLDDCLKKDGQSPVSKFSGGNHHGPVEALKHMLFNLQTFQQNFSQGKPAEQGKEVKNTSKQANSELLHFDQEMFPVNKSLQKAMLHLSRLKELVSDVSVNHKEEKNQEP